MVSSNSLTAQDRFEIFEQLNLHQQSIDGNDSRASAEKYVSLYWEDAKFTVSNMCQNQFDGADGMKQLYDYAHSVFPLHKMRHAMGTFAIDGAGSDATAQWHWTVTWKAQKPGLVSTGSYSDLFQKRGGVWKCASRVLNVDPNWPAALFKPWINQRLSAFKES